MKQLTWRVQNAPRDDFLGGLNGETKIRKKNVQMSGLAEAWVNPGEAASGCLDEHPEILENRHPG